MRVLIAGGSGQVGTALRESAPNGILLRAPSSREMDIRSVTSVDAAFAAWQPDLTVNAAAYTQVDRAEGQTELALAVNRNGTRNLAVACAKSGCRLIHLSTDYVFDGKKTEPYFEHDIPIPLNAYGRSKLEGERTVRDHLRQHLILRVSWVFGSQGSNFVKTMLGLASHDTIRVVNDQHGTPCAASNIAEAIWQIAARWSPMSRTGTYHFACTPPTTWYDFARAVYSCLREVQPARRTPEVVPITSTEWTTVAKRPTNSLLDSRKLRRDFGIDTPDWRTALLSVVRQLVAP